MRAHDDTEQLARRIRRHTYDRRGQIAGRRAYREHANVRHPFVYPIEKEALALLVLSRARSELYSAELVPYKLRRRAFYRAERNKPFYALFKALRGLFGIGLFLCARDGAFRFAVKRLTIYIPPLFDIIATHYQLKLPIIPKHKGGTLSACRLVSLFLKFSRTFGYRTGPLAAFVPRSRVPPTRRYTHRCPTVRA